ncbi:MAG: hypothetical protein ACP5H5_08005 [Pyrobaculum sp.]
MSKGWHYGRFARFNYLLISGSCTASGRVVCITARFQLSFDFWIS